MLNGTLDFYVDVNIGELQKDLITEINAVLDLALNKTAHNIRPQIKLKVYNSLVTSPEYLSMMGKYYPHDLHAQFGFDNPERIVNPIITNIINLIDVKVVPMKRGTGQINVSLFDGDYSHLVNLPTASYQSNGHQISWLEWLLLKGNSIINTGYRIKFGLWNWSRSKKALMYKGGVWKIEQSEFTGTPTNNFITRAIISIINDNIMPLFESEMGRVLSKL